MSKKKLKPLPLSVTQLEHLISVSIRNNLDIIGSPLDGGYKYMIILDCLAPEDCIPHDLPPETEEESWDILESHGVAELAEFLDNIMGISRDGVVSRAVETCIIDSNNIEEFLKILDGMCNYWDEVMDEPEQPVDLKGKNVVEGNGTVQ